MYFCQPAKTQIMEEYSLIEMNVYIQYPKHIVSFFPSEMINQGPVH